MPIQTAKRLARLAQISWEYLPHILRLVRLADQIRGLTSTDRRDLVTGILRAAESQIASLAADDRDVPHVDQSGFPSEWAMPDADGQRHE